jgi:hypothetical protein
MMKDTCVPITVHVLGVLLEIVTTNPVEAVATTVYLLPTVGELGVEVIDTVCVPFPTVIVCCTIWFAVISGTNERKIRHAVPLTHLLAPR